MGLWGYEVVCLLNEQQQSEWMKDFVAEFQFLCEPDAGKTSNLGALPWKL